MAGSCSTSGTIVSGAIDQDDPRRYIVNVSDVTDGQYLRITLNGVSGAEGIYSDTVSEEVGVLLGDASPGGSVNTSDVGEVKAASGAPVTAANFRKDLNANGSINSTDVGLVKSASGSVLPSLP